MQGVFALQGRCCCEKNFKCCFLKKSILSYHYHISLYNCNCFFAETVLLFSLASEQVHASDREVLVHMEMIRPPSWFSFDVMFLWKQARVWTCQDKTWLGISNKNALIMSSVCACVHAHVHVCIPTCLSLCPDLPDLVAWASSGSTRSNTRSQSSKWLSK